MFDEKHDEMQPTEQRDGPEILGAEQERQPLGDKEQAPRQRPIVGNPAPEELARIKINHAARDFLEAPDLLDLVVADTEALGYAGQDRKIKLLYLVATSRRLEEPLAASINSPASSGKSAGLETILKFVPDDEKRVFSRITKNALYYEGGDDKHYLQNRFVVIQEAAGSKEAAYALRTLLTEKRLIVSTGAGGGRTRERYGPIAYCETDAGKFPDRETGSRLLILKLDTGPDQLGRASSSMLERAAGDFRREDTAIIDKQLAAQGLLHKRARVKIPFSKRIRFPLFSELALRELSKFLAVIKASAYLHQLQRETEFKDGVNLIHADERDFAVALELVGGPIMEALGGAMPGRSREVLEAVREFGEAFSRKAIIDAVQESGLSYRQVDYALPFLLEQGVISKDGRVYRHVPENDLGSISLLEESQNHNESRGIKH